MLPAINMKNEDNIFVLLAKNAFDTRLRRRRDGGTENPVALVQRMGQRRALITLTTVRLGSYNRVC
jgi:hypothetical protein